MVVPGLDSARAAAPNGQSDDELSSQAEETTAPLRTVELNDWYNATLHQQDGSINQAIFRVIAPFTADGIPHWSRFTLPYTTSATSGKTGTGDAELVELRGFDESWGRFGAGAVVQMPTGADAVTSNKWSVGPSLGMSTMGDTKYRWGFLLRTYWSVAGESSAKNVGIVNFQPNFTLQLGEGRTLSLGQTQLVYDTAASRWKSLQLGLKLGGVSRTRAWSGIRWKPTAEIDYDFRKIRGDPEWTARVGITMLMPRR